MTIPAIGAISGLGAGGSVSAALSAAMPSADPTSASGASGGNFATMLSNGINAVQASQTNADNLAVQAATGDLTNVADYDRRNPGLLDDQSRLDLADQGRRSL